ncbi:30S ribosomal protein S18 [Candidatus Sumerlaeota bacterium]|nr:30S ribosomal protein S18 [Candidatus Sumerlaeota bacterium]MBI3736822.1 30S ribosomal protein S18 [Candidatus Sumerlaeota bacterium]
MSERRRDDDFEGEGFDRGDGDDRGQGGEGDDRGSRRGGPRRFHRGKVCGFCVDKAVYIDYKDLERLRRYVTDRGKVLPRRITGNCATHQRMVTTAIKRARNIALIPFKAK